MRLRFIFAVLMFVAIAPQCFSEIWADYDEVKGYWWYRDDTKDEKPKVEKPPEYTREQLAKMAPKELGKLHDQYLDYAIWSKDPGAVKQYYEVVDTMRRNARAFMNNSKYVMLSNPELNARAEYAHNTSTKTAVTKQREDMLRQTLAAQGDKYGLIIVTTPGCAYCEIQRGVLSNIQANYGLPYGEIDASSTPGVAEKFDVRTYPVTLLVERGSTRSMSVAVGASTVTETLRNTVTAIRYLGGQSDSSQFEYDGATPFRDPHRYDGDKE